MAVDLVDLIFIEILKISPTLLSKYYTLQDQIFHLFLLPHVLLFLFLYSFSYGFVGRFVGGHKGMSILLGAVTYIFIVYEGWYGTFLVPIFTTWFTIALFFALILFMITIVIHPARGPALTKMSGQLATGLGKRTIAKSKELDNLQKQLDDKNKELAKAKDRYNKLLSDARAQGTYPNPHTEDEYVKTINRLEDERKRLLKEIDKY